MYILKKATSSILRHLPASLFSRVEPLVADEARCRSSRREALSLLQDPNSSHPINVDVRVAILPPWPGEFGFEIRYALPRLEVLAPAGVKVLTRRASIYPKGCGIFDADYFQQEDKLFGKYKVIRSGIAAVPTRGCPLEFENEWKDIFYSRGWDDYGLGRTISWEPFCIHNPKINLLAAHSYFSFARYNPLLSINEALLLQKPVPSHIGVQFRLRNERPDGRNTPLHDVMVFCNRLSDQLHVPLIVYGKDVPLNEIGRIRHADSFTRAHPDQLARDMCVLKHCKVFVAPDSGWADFLAWLGIPIILQMDKYNSAEAFVRQGRCVALMNDACSVRILLEKLAANQSR